MRVWQCLAVCLWTAIGCSGGPGRRDSGTNDGDGGRDAGAADGGAVPPNIREALDCRFASTPGMGTGDMQKHELDLARFPDALCNDGTTAVLHFRPYRGEENRDRWVIALRGGGSCGTPEACAARYCGCSDSRASRCPAVAPEDRTSFTADNMTGESPPRVAGNGIFLRDGGLAMPNPIEGYNMVRLTYCSSDQWVGTRRDSPMTTVHPVTGEPVELSIHFLGARILDASIATLRRDGVPPLTYTLDGSAELPDLDEAREVIFAGDSGGGAGVINNLDRLRALLVENNVHCGGATCPLEVRGLIDAIVGPDLGALDWSGTGATYEGYLTALENGPDLLQGAIGDTSCESWHAANEPATIGRCSDISHVVRDHVTTPFFVRMALADMLISRGYIELGLADPALGPLDTAVFARVLARELATFPALPTDAEERDDMTQAPGVFAPGCTNHDTLFENGEVYMTTIDDGSGAELRLFDVFEPWRAGGPGEAVVPMTMADSHCDMAP